MGSFSNQLFYLYWSYKTSTFLTDWEGSQLDEGGFYPQNYNWGDPITGFDLLNSQTTIADDGRSSTSQFIWTNGTDTSTYNFNDSSELNSWNFYCKGWDFNTGNFISYTGLNQDTPTSIVGSLPLGRNFNFNSQPCSFSFGGHPLSVSSLDDTNLGMLMILNFRPSFQFISSVYEMTKGKFLYLNYIPR